MIQLIVDGCVFSQEDSCQYIGFKIVEIFNGLMDFRNCTEIHNSMYWGEYILNGTEDDYCTWIKQTAEIFLK